MKNENQIGLANVAVGDVVILRNADHAVEDCVAVLRQSCEEEGDGKYMAYVSPVVDPDAYPLVVTDFAEARSLGIEL